MSNLVVEEIKSGIYNMTNDQYHLSPGISKSGLDYFGRSPAHFQAKKFTQTKEMLIGSAVHKVVLEMKDFSNEFAVVKKFDKRTKKGKSQALFDEKNNQGKMILTTEDMQQVMNIGMSVFKDKTAYQLLNTGMPEQSIYWYDDETGELCKCRPDWQYNENIIIDLKTTVDASPNAFARTISKYNYDMQAAFYTDGCRSIGMDINYFIFIAVEKEAPYGVGKYTISDESLQKGRIKYKKYLQEYSECKRSNNWPGYSDEIIELTT